jgi:uncharacterized membrane protein YfcA
MTGWQISALFASAVVAGAVNAIAGGGTLVTFPVLLVTGTTAVVANATSTLALMIGTAGGIFGYRRQVAAVRPWLSRFVPVSLAGGLVGSALLTYGRPEVFATLVPYLILFATILFLAQDVFRRMARRSLAAAPDDGTVSDGRHGLFWAVVFQFCVAVYGGYFGAGIGILMLATLGFLGLRHIHQMNALKNILGSLINMVAAVWFVANGLIDWPKAGIMTVGALVGYYSGAHFSQRIPQERVRVVITCIGFVAAAWTFWK